MINRKADPELFIKIKSKLYNRVSNTKEYVDEDWYIYIINKKDITNENCFDKRIECYISKSGELEYYKEEIGELGEIFIAGSKIDCNEHMWIANKILFGDIKKLWDSELACRIKQSPLLYIKQKEDWKMRIHDVNNY